VHFPRPRLVIIENTHNRGGGTIYPVETVRDIARVCREHRLRLHMDGARLWNACVATGAAPQDYAQHVDSVTVCLSKGLGAPVGSVVAGTREFIARARRVRKMLGGGMRQAGYLAAAGIHALEHNIKRLAEDHEHARLLADGVRQCAGLRLVHDPPATNMVYFDVLPPHTSEEFAKLIAQEGILIGGMGRTSFRAVPHIGITRADIKRVIRVLQAHFR
jgi:threonine aldolase